MSIFSGNYINFGYWHDFTPGRISVGERTKSQANLYRTVLRRLKIDPTDVTLELPYAGETFDKCYSVEAAQHFEDLTRFASEAHRVLKPGGWLAVTTCFTPYPNAVDGLRRLLENINNGIDVVFTIDSFRDDLLEVGFVDVRVENIGEHAWRGFDAWMDQTEFRDSWGRNWLTAYNRGLIDYYLVTADKK